MAAYLSPEWFDAQLRSAADLPERPGASAVVQHVVAGGPEGEVSYVTRVVDGRVTELGPGAADDAEATLATPYAQGAAIATGKLDLNAAFMQGLVKTAGRTGPLLTFIALTQDPAWAAPLAELAASTDA